MEASACDNESVQSKPGWRQRIASILFEYHLPIGLLLLVTFGILVPQPGNFMSTLPTQFICVVCIFFISGLKLRTDELLIAIKSYKASLWGLLSIFLVTPAIGTQLTKLLPFMPSTVSNSTIANNATNILGPEDFSIGLQLFFCSPCTISTGVLMVGQAGGNYALAVMLTVTSNTLGVFISPFIVSWLTSINSNINMEDIGRMVLNLSLTVLLPLIVGKGLSYIKAVTKVVKRFNKTLKLISSFALIIIPWMKVSRARIDGAFDLVAPINIVMLILWAITIHVLFLIANSSVSWLILRLELKMIKSVVILASQKTIAIAVVLISYSPPTVASQGLMTVAAIIAHMSQIIVDAFVVAKWSKYQDDQPATDMKDIANGHTAFNGTDNEIRRNNLKDDVGYAKTIYESNV